MVSIYCSYVWKSKPVIIKGSLKRFRNYQFIKDVVNILFKSIKNKKLKKFEIFNLTTGKSTKVSDLLKIIFSEKNYKNYKVIEKKLLRGLLRLSRFKPVPYEKFDNYKFISLKDGIKSILNGLIKYQLKDLKNYHPFIMNLKKMKK